MGLAARPGRARPDRPQRPRDPARHRTPNAAPDRNRRLGIGVGDGGFPAGGAGCAVSLCRRRVDVLTEPTGGPFSRGRRGPFFGSPPDARASPSRFRHMRSATRSPSTSSRRAPTCVRFSFCSGIGACSGWVACRPGFFLPVRVLSRYFRRVLLQALQDAFESGQLHFAGRLQSLGDPRRFADHLRPARETEWVVYAKRPFAGPEQVLDYLGRYTHRIAISDQRLCSLDDSSVRFRYKDYRRAGASRQKTMTLTATEFIRRMLLHVLPPGFHRIRYYGFLANRTRRQKLTECRRLLSTPPASPPEQAGRTATDYRDRYGGADRSLVAAVSPVRRRKHARRRPPRPQVGVSGHRGFVVTTPPTPARYRPLPAFPGRSTCVSDASPGSRDGSRGHRHRPSPPGNRHVRPRGRHPSSTSRRCNAHSRAAEQRFSPTHS